MHAQHKPTPTVDEGREEIVFGRTIDWGEETSGGLVRIGSLGPMDRGIGPKTARELLEEGYILPDGSHGYAPTNETLIEFAEGIIEDHESRLGVELTGYMISPNRDTPRIRFTAINLGVTHVADLYANAVIPRSVADDFREAFFPADERVDKPTFMSAWWD